MFSLRYRLARDLTTLQIAKRYKSKKWKQKQNTGSVNALKHFDDFYKFIFKKSWPSIRLALLSEEKKVAIVNNFGNPEETEKLLKNAGAMDLRILVENAKIDSEKSENSKELLTDQGKTDLDEVIGKYASEKTSEEINLLYSENSWGTEFSPKFVDDDDDSKESRNDENEDNDEYIYSPEHSMTSLQDDMTKAQLEKGRLILPNSIMGEGSLHEFVPATKLRSREEYISESEYYKFYQPKSEMSINIETEETNINIPKNLKVYTFHRGDISSFPDRVRCSNDVYNFYEVNGADILSVLALDLQEGDAVLDMCSPFADKAFCIFQSLLTKFFVCNNRKKAESVFRDYLFDYSPTWNKILLLSKLNYEEDRNIDLFNKILVDVPCTDDRLSLSEPHDNIFRPIKIRERLKLPEEQTYLLTRALKLVCSGGTVVYSTSTLSPIQNDAVVAEALRILWFEDKKEFTVKDLNPALKHFSNYFRFGSNLDLKYGTLVLPFIPCNFGPRYVCKIVKK